MNPVEILANNLAKFNVNATIEQILSSGDYPKALPDWIKERLWEQGLYSTGEEIRTYSATNNNVYAVTTVIGTPEFEGKMAKGQPYDRVTLRDTGAFYNTFSLKPKQASFTIDYNDTKSDGDISDNVADLPSVFGFSDGEMDALRKKILPDFITAFKNAIKV